MEAAWRMLWLLGLFTCVMSNLLFFLRRPSVVRSTLFLDDGNRIVILVLDHLGNRRCRGISEVINFCKITCRLTGVIIISTVSNRIRVNIVERLNPLKRLEKEVWLGPGCLILKHAWCRRDIYSHRQLWVWVRRGYNLHRVRRVSELWFSGVSFAKQRRAWLWKLLLRCTLSKR